MDKGDKRKKQLLRVALDIFIKKGYYSTSTREIARQAGVSSGLLFHYFSNKESIYLELIKIGIQEMKINTENSFFAKMFVFMDNVQYTVVNEKEITSLLELADICKQWVPIILERQQRSKFREGNPIHYVSLFLVLYREWHRKKSESPACHCKK